MTSAETQQGLSLGCPVGGSNRKPDVREDHLASFPQNGVGGNRETQQAKPEHANPSPPHFIPGTEIDLQQEQGDFLE